MVGSTISHYKILEKLGEGGMGVVYKAQDTKLDRLVALKFLPPQASATQETKDRFMQEAKAAAALNHNNICTVYGVEEHGSQMFISMEFIEGGTLQGKIPFAKSDDALTTAIQIGEALQEAHTKGIVHRDIKSDNVMLTAKGQAKVMDFGLAKLRGSLKLTRASSTVGTLAYMAPEQVQGGEVDSRSDIFSFGVLLFEMLTGKTPFRGEHEAAIVYSIVNEEPEALQKYVPNASPELQYIIKSALEKNPEDRYQQISDVVRDLRRLKKQTSRVGKVPAGYQAPEQPSGSVTAGSAIPVTAVFQKRIRLLIYGAIALAVVLVAVTVVFLLPKGEKVPFVKSKFIRITSTGKARLAAISPDGRYISYSQDDAGRTSLWVRQIATSSNIQVVPPQTTDLAGLTFSRDGNFIYYTQSSEQSVIRDLYRIPVLGGTPARVLSDIVSSASFSPDSKQITFIRRVASTGDFSVIIANADGSGERTLGAHRGETWFDGDPSWSPDGKTIAASLGSWKGGFHASLMGLDVESGAERSLSKKSWRIIWSIQWESTGTGMFVRGDERGSDRSQLYFVASPSGDVHRITNDANHYSSSSATAGGENLCATQKDVNFKLHYVPNRNSDLARVITNQKDDGLLGLTTGENGEIYFISSQGGNYDIFTVKNDGANLRQITSDPDLEIGLSLTPDGKTLLYSASNAASTPSIVRINIDGSGRTPLTSGAEDYDPVMEPDGKWIFISSWFRGPLTVMKIPVPGGERVDVSGFDGMLPVLSPDGKFVYFLHLGDQSPTVSVFSVSIDGGTPKRQFDLPRQALQGAQDFGSPFMRNLRWRPKSRQLSYVLTTGGVSNIWVCSPDGSGARQFTNFKKDFIANFAWMPDGNSLVVSRGETTTDVILITQEQ